MLLRKAYERSEKPRLTSTSRVQLNMVKLEPVAPEEATEPATVPPVVTTDLRALVSARRATTGDVEIDNAENTRCRIEEIIDAVQDSIEWRNLMCSWHLSDLRGKKTLHKPGSRALTMEML